MAEKRKAEQQKKAEEAKREGSPEKTDKSKMKMSQSSIDRLSAPKQVKVKEDTPTKQEPVKATHVSITVGLDIVSLLVKVREEVDKFI